MGNFLSKSECSKIKEQILRGESKIDLFTEEELNVFTDYLLDTLNPDSESDTNLLEQCYTALSVYTDIDRQMPTEQYNAMAESVIGTLEPKRTHVPAKKLIILVAAVIAILALTGCSIVGLIFFDVINLGKDLLNLEENVSETQGNMEIVRTDDYIEYKNFEELIKTQDYPDIYPKDMPDDFIFETAEVIFVDNKKQINIVYTNPNDEKIKISVLENADQLGNGEIVCIDGRNICLNEYSDKYQGSFLYEGNMYIIICSDKELLYEMINNLEEN